MLRNNFYARSVCIKTAPEELVTQQNRYTRTETEHERHTMLR